MDHKGSDSDSDLQQDMSITTEPSGSEPKTDETPTKQRKPNLKESPGMSFEIGVLPNQKEIKENRKYFQDECDLYHAETLVCHPISENFLLPRNCAYYPK